MRRICLGVLLLTPVVSVWWTGCSRAPDPRTEQATSPAPPALTNAREVTDPVSVPVQAAAPAPSAAPVTTFSLAPRTPTAQEKYDAALLEAVHLLADRKYPEALASLEAAQYYQNTEQVRGEIDRVKALLDQQAAARKTVQDIQTVLTSGKSEEAGRLATAALQQYGATDAADSLTALKRQADALLAAQGDDQAARRSRLVQEGDAAFRDRNLRAAVVAWEQALQLGPDDDLRRRYDDVRATLTRYDENRQRALELRRDPYSLEDAVAALQEAGRAWDTPQVRQEIDDCTLALQTRRDRIGVADFEVRGDVGLPLAGRAVADELLPAFKGRFDLVERGQLEQVVQELKLEGSELASNETGRREVGRLAKLRYLVVGSITPLGGITVNARLVEVRTGLVVQTAKIVAGSPQEMLALLPQLARVLMMSDAERIAYEQSLVRQAAVVVQPVALAPLPPPPELLAVGAPPPPPVVVYTPRPPDFGGLRIDDFDRLPPPGRVTVSAEIVLRHDDPVRQRSLQLAVELGDNLFRRGKFQEAHRHFELALSLAPDRQEIQVRLDRCRPRLPPPVVVVVAPPPPPRPRIAVLSFLVNADAAHAPPGFGDWAADQVACHFTPAYEVIDRGELFWYMGRLGITVRDVVTNVSARVCLARALNVRCFVFGVVQQTASFNVTTHLVDAESGSRQGLGSIHVQDQQELKLRVRELAQQTQTSPAEQARLQQEAKESEQQLNEARRLCQAGDPARAIQVCQEALKRHPDNVAFQVLLQQAQQQLQQAKLEEARKVEAARRQAELAAAQQKQRELAQAAEAARRRAEQEAAAQSEAIRRAQEQQKQRAYDQLLAQGRAALQQGNHPQAVQAFQGAAALKPGGEAAGELARARDAAQKAEQERARAEQERRHQAELQKQQQALEQARLQVEQEKLRREAADRAQRAAQEARDQAAYAKLLEDGKQALAKKQYAAATSALQGARQLKKSDEVDRLLAQAQAAQVQEQARQKEAQARADAERRLAEEKARHDQAEAARTRAVVQAPVPPPQPKPEARPAPAPPPALSQGPAPTRSATVAPTPPKADGPPKPQPIAAAPAAPKMEQKAPVQQAPPAAGIGTTPRPVTPPTTIPARPAEPPKAEAAKVPAPLGSPAPAKVEVPAKPQAAVAPSPAPVAPPTRVGAPSKAPTPPPQPVSPSTEYARQMQAGAAFEKQQKYAEAVRAYQDALKLQPKDAKAAAALRNAEFTQHMAEGQKAMTARRFPDAAREFEAALKLMPNHPEATKALKQAREGKP